MAIGPLLALLLWPGKLSFGQRDVSCRGKTCLRNDAKHNLPGLFTALIRASAPNPLPLIDRVGDVLPLDRFVKSVRLVLLRY